MQWKGLIDGTDVSNIHFAVENVANVFSVGGEEPYADTAIRTDMTRHGNHFVRNLSSFQEFLGKQCFACRVEKKDKTTFHIGHILTTLPADSMVSAMSYMFDIIPARIFSLSPKKSRQVPHTRMLIPESSRV